MNFVSDILIDQVNVIRTWNEDILIWSANELHGLLCKNCHVLIGSIARNILICTVIQGNENVQEN